MSDLSMKPTQDELVSRRGPSKRQPSNKKSDGGGSGSGWKVITALVLIMLGGAAYFLWNKVQELDSALSTSTDALKTSQEQLGTLESKVITQDKSLSMTGDKVASAVSKLDSEVRKLWDLNNKSNRPAIEALQKSFQGMQAKLDEETKARTVLTTQLSQSQAEVKALKGDLAKLEAEAKNNDKINALQDAVASLKAQQQSLAETQESVKAEQETLQAQISKQQSQIAGINKTPSAAPVSGDLTRRLAEVETDIKSINAHRLQVNSRLDQLDQDIQGIYKRR